MAQLRYELAPTVEIGESFKRYIEQGIPSCELNQRKDRPMENPNRFTESDREAVLKVLANEQELKANGQPYSESVIIACEACLRVNTRAPVVEAVKDYWWNKD